MWILGGLFLFVGGVAGLMIRIAVLMFSWRREIDESLMANKLGIARLEEWKEGHEDKAERNLDEINRLRDRVNKLYNSKKENKA